MCITTEEVHDHKGGHEAKVPSMPKMEIAGARARINGRCTIR